MTNENIAPAPTAPAPGGVEAMLARLPEAYAEWESDCAPAHADK